MMILFFCNYVIYFFISAFLLCFLSFILIRIEKLAFTVNPDFYLSIVFVSNFNFLSQYVIVLCFKNILTYLYSNFHLWNYWCVRTALKIVGVFLNASLWSHKDLKKNIYPHPHHIRSSAITIWNEEYRFNSVLLVFPRFSFFGCNNFLSL